MISEFWYMANTLKTEKSLLVSKNRSLVGQILDSLKINLVRLVGIPYLLLGVI